MLDLVQSLCISSHLLPRVLSPIPISMQNGLFFSEESLAVSTHSISGCVTARSLKFFFLKCPSHIQMYDIIIDHFFLILHPHHTHTPHPKPSFPVYQQWSSETFPQYPRGPGYCVPVSLCCIHWTPIFTLWRCCPFHGSLGFFLKECSHFHRARF